jgi:hypothetical protein
MESVSMNWIGECNNVCRIIYCRNNSPFAYMTFSKYSDGLYTFDGIVKVWDYTPGKDSVWTEKVDFVLRNSEKIRTMIFQYIKSL